MKVKFITLGCKVNTYETQKISQNFKNSGFEIVEENANIYIINTCSVTSIADKKSRQMIRACKKQNPDAIVVATGCFVEQKIDFKNVLPEVDLVVGNAKKNEIVSIVQKYIKDKDFVVKNVDINDPKLKYLELEDKNGIDIIDTPKTLETNDTIVRKNIKIQDGCNNFCTYCIIPYLRGRNRSRKEENIIDEINKSVKSGTKEIILTRINIASYGKDTNTSLIELLTKINEIKGLESIRISSLEPTQINDEFVKKLKELKKVRSNFHLSIQSLDDFVLKKMNRNYMVNDVVLAIKTLRKYYDNPLISCDIIVGFPYESDQYFENTYKMLEKLNLYKLHVFKYSKRNGTPAKDFDCQILDNVKSIRSKRLIELSKMQEEKYNLGFIGKTLNILVEELKDGYYLGHSKEFVKVKIPKQNFDTNVINTNVDFKVKSLEDIIPM